MDEARPNEDAIAVAYQRGMEDGYRLPRTLDDAEVTRQGTERGEQWAAAARTGTVTRTGSKRRRPATGRAQPARAPRRPAGPRSSSRGPADLQRQSDCQAGREHRRGECNDSHDEAQERYIVQRH